MGGVEGVKHARSTPAENVFSRAEDSTTTRTVLSSEIRSNAAPYSRQNLIRIYGMCSPQGQSPSLDQSRPYNLNLLFIECIHGWSKTRNRGDGQRLCYKEFRLVLTNLNGPFEFNVEHVFGRKAHGEMLELRGI